MGRVDVDSRYRHCRNVVSLPLGIVLALGRQAENLPALRFMSIIFIEFWRAVPLITVLFMSSVMLPLFLPEGVNFDNLLRALGGCYLIYRRLSGGSRAWRFGGHPQRAI